MRRALLICVLPVLAVFAACSSESQPEPSKAGPTTNVDAGADVQAVDVAPQPVVDSGNVTVDTGSDANVPLDVNAILAKLANCNEITTTKYKTDANESTATIPVCALTNAVFWKADMDIDCDGKETAVCNDESDPSFLNETSANDSMGNPLDSSTLPFIVIPLPSTRFDYNDHAIELGTVAMVVYKGKYEFGVFGDQGPTTIIGEASYAMAEKLGIDPDPAIGGTDSGVTYIVFTGESAVVTKMEDHAEAVRIGEMRARQLLTEN